jgi:general secretion pathway protein L
VDEVQVTVRLSEQEGLGVAMPSESSAGDVLDTVSAVGRDAPLVLYVPEALAEAYRGAIAAMPALSSRATIAREDWSCWLDGADNAGMNLLAGLDVRYGGRDRDWRQWRWPMALAAAVLAINLFGLYTDWWRMKSESDRLRADMLQTFKSAYPKESVILDPVAQMKQKIAASRRASGEPAADDFLVLVSGFGEAWTRVAQSPPNRKPPQIAALEYRYRSLLVRAQAGTELPEDKLAEEMRARGLSLSQPAAGTWQIRSIK